MRAQQGDAFLFAFDGNCQHVFVNFKFFFAKFCKLAFQTFCHKHNNVHQAQHNARCANCHHNCNVHLLPPNFKTATPWCKNAHFFNVGSCFCVHCTKCCCTLVASICRYLPCFATGMFLQVLHMLVQNEKGGFP